GEEAVTKAALGARRSALGGEVGRAAGRPVLDPVGPSAERRAPSAALVPPAFPHRDLLPLRLQGDMAAVARLQDDPPPPPDPAPEPAGPLVDLDRPGRAAQAEALRLGHALEARPVAVERRQEPCRAPDALPHPRGEDAVELRHLDLSQEF